MPALLGPWAPVVGPSNSYTASAPTYEGGPVLLLTVTRSAVDGLWHAVIENKNRMDFSLTRRPSQSPFAIKRLAQDWAEHEAEVMAAGMLPFPPGPES